MDYSRKLTLALQGADDWEFAGGDTRPAHRERWKLLFDGRKKPATEISCVCGHSIVENCYLYSRSLNEVVVLGNCCIRRFLPRAEDRLKKCVVCACRHRNRHKLCNICREKCCRRSKLDSNLQCPRCRDLWIICKECGKLHRLGKDCMCVHGSASDQCSICRWKKVEKYEKIYYSATVNDIDYLVGLKRTGYVWVKVDNMFFDTRYNGLSEDTLRLLMESISAGEFTHKK